MIVDVSGSGDLLSRYWQQWLVPTKSTNADDDDDDEDYGDDDYDDCYNDGNDTDEGTIDDGDVGTNRPKAIYPHHYHHI